MKNNWTEIILNPKTTQTAWEAIFMALLEMARETVDPTALHNATVEPDRLLSEAAWELWEAYPEHAVLTSSELNKWAGHGTSKAILILDALSLRELSILLGNARKRGIQPVQVKVTGSECPSTTDQFAHALGLQSRSALVNNKKPGTFTLFDESCFTDVVSIPFEDCKIPPTPDIVIWHTWLDDLIHLQNKNSDQISNIVSSVFKSDGFWGFIDRLRKGRNLIITSDHGYAVSKRFSAEFEDANAIEILRKSFGASRTIPQSEPWQNRFMPPVVMSHNEHQMIMGQWKWKVQGGFPPICHGGLSLLEVAVPYLELPAL